MKALGIVAMIFAVVCIIIPGVGPYLTVVAGILAAFAAGPGLTFGAVAIGVNIVNIFFLSPSLLIIEAAAQANDEIGHIVYLLLVQIVAAAVLAVVHKNVSSKSTGGDAVDDPSLKEEQ